jgi:hypothetical protein
MSPIKSDMLSPNTFEHDKLALKPFCEKLEQFVIIDHDFAEGSLVVALTSPFGTGKSTFLRMWKNDLDRRRINQVDTPEAVILNAWELDYCEDPLFAILAKLIKAVPKSDDEKVKAVREAVADFGHFALSLANDITSKIGVDAMKAGDHAKKKKQERQQKPDFLKMFEERTDAYERLKEALKEAFGGDSPRAFIFVDELDRCRPDYAISYLETIKHVFDIHGLVFVLSIDYDHLQSSARSLFGQELAFPEYLRKFVQRTFKLPAITTEGYEKLSHFYVERFIEIVGKRSCMMKVDSFADRTEELVAGFKMNPRQIQEAFRIMGHVLSGTEEKRGKLYWCLGASTILLSVLKIKLPLVYESISKDTQDHSAFGKSLIEKLLKDNAEWWFRLYLSGAASSSQGSKQIENALRELNMLSQDQPYNEQKEFGGFAGGWGHWFGSSERSRFATVCDKIENAARFS